MRITTISLKSQPTAATSFNLHQPDDIQGDAASHHYVRHRASLVLRKPHQRDLLAGSNFRHEEPESEHRRTL